VIALGSRYSVSEAAREGRLRTTEAAITDCIKRWATHWPHEVVEIKNEVEHIKAVQQHSKGWTREKHMLHKGKVPVRLHQLMRREVDKNWLDIPELRNMFFRLFKIGCINHSDLSER
jgi:hypothetical protein